jgi:mercuric ion binding protein
MRVWALGLVAMLWTGLAFAGTPQTVVLQVKNMTCPACSITIEKALEKMQGVSGQRIDTEAGTVTVTFDGERTSVPKVAEAITNAGFPAQAKATDG